MTKKICWQMWVARALLLVVDSIHVIKQHNEHKTKDSFELIVTPRWEKKGSQDLVLSPAYANDLDYRSPSQQQGLLIWFWLNQICRIKVRRSNKDWQSGRGTTRFLWDYFCPVHCYLHTFLPNSHACLSEFTASFLSPARPYLLDRHMMTEVRVIHKWKCLSLKRQLLKVLWWETWQLSTQLLIHSSCLLSVRIKKKSSSFSIQVTAQKSCETILIFPLPKDTRLSDTASESALQLGG